MDPGVPKVLVRCNPKLLLGVNNQVLEDISIYGDDGEDEEPVKDQGSIMITIGRLVFGRDRY